jgi:uncharacterized protein
MKCPHDGAELAGLTYEADIEVDRCPDCRGMWLDKGELEAIQQTVERSYADEIKKIPDTALTQYKAARSARSLDSLKCPKCSEELHTREHGYCSQIYVDVCPACEGLWLDDGELAALEIFFERSQLDTPKIRKSFWRSLSDLFIHGIVPED